MAMDANGGTITYRIEVDSSGAVVGIKNAESDMIAAAGDSGTKSGNKLSKAWAVAVGAIQGVTQEIFRKVTQTISAQVSDAVYRADTLERFPKVMSQMGYSAEDASTAVEKLRKGVEQVPTSLADVTSGTQRLVATTKDVSKAADWMLAISDAMISNGASADDAARATEQFLQVVSRGKPTGQDWLTMMEVAPGALDDIAKSLGYTSAAMGGDLYTALQSGTLSMEDFMNQVVKLDQEGGDGITAFSERAITASGGISTAMTVMRQKISNALVSVIQDTGFDRFTTAFSSLGQIFAGAIKGEDITKPLESLGNSMKTILPKLIEVATRTIVALTQAIVAMLPAISQALIESLPVIIDGISTLAVSIAGALPEILLIILNALPEIINKIVTVIPTIVDALVAALTNPSMLNQILQAGITLLLSLVAALPQIIVALTNALPTIIDNIVTFLTDPQTISALIEASVLLFLGIAKAVPQILGALFNAFGTLFGNLWDRVKTLFGEFAGNFGNFIGDIFKKAINGVLGFIENFINAPMRLINGFIDLINGAFGAIGVNIGHVPTVSLPRLASGGIVEATNGGRLILAGEGGEDEWVVPESKMGSLIDQLNGGGGTVNIYVDGVFATSAEERRKVAEDIMEAYSQNQKRRFANA